MTESEKSKTKLICIDDEVFILEALKRMLRKEFEVLTATNAFEAYEIIKNEGEVGVAIVDQRMPEVSGVEVLEYLTQNHPEIVKIVLTGYTDMSALVDSINKGQVFKYISKPWEPDELREAIHAAVEKFERHNKYSRLEAQLMDANEELKRLRDSAD